jgi:hypothetical protein
MKHAREDYNRIQDPEHLIPADEPVFLLRAQDYLAAGIVAEWANRNEKRGGDSELTAAARRQSAAMAAWPVKKQADGVIGSQVLTDEQYYLQHKGIRCPFCHSDELDGGSVTTNEGGAEQSISCLNCDSEWTDRYTLTGIDDIENLNTKFKVGDRVVWRDLDRDIASGPGKIVKIADDAFDVDTFTIITVALDSGSEAEVLPAELRPEAKQVAYG